ncbi:hypothetical protein [Lacrimispora sp. 210928-DFI.3.58]|uniref:hypothetical protein n=1 Tax=Lacrimispora sp. 210928-DFI.3.58 TaxID=2883214 RepID=UPI001D08BC2F|nr:hypothetical protein [Lacrimispora sp. 210928-DFI.3.58]
MCDTRKIWGLPGKTISYIGKIPCHECSRIDDDETMCPNIGHPEKCPQKRYTLRVRSVACEILGPYVLYTVNGHSFREDEIGRIEILHLPGGPP